MSAVRWWQELKQPGGRLDSPLSSPPAVSELAFRAVGLLTWYLKFSRRSMTVTK